MANDKQRERLVELLEEADQKVQEYILENDHMDWIPKAKELSEVRANYLLANGVIVPPLKVSDRVFFVHEMCDKNGKEYLDISAGEVVSISIQPEGLWAYCRYFDGLTYWHKLYEDFGKTVFLTKEEAEKALGGVQG